MQQKALTKLSTSSGNSLRKQSVVKSDVEHPLKGLQQSIGNRAVQRLVQSHYIQAKLQVSSPGDQFEQEADRVADTVMRMPEPANPVAQRQVDKDDEEEKPIQAKPAEASTQSSPSRAHVASTLTLSSGQGRPLPDTIRNYMEPRFGTDFGQVKVHTDSDAIQMNRAVGAQAFTHGCDIYYGAGHGPNNLDLTAHELTHVLQQTADHGARGAKTNHSNATGPKLSIQRNPAAQIQRRLIVSGSTEALVREYLGVVGGAAGLVLNWTFATPRVTTGGNLPGAVPSPSGRSNILSVINHPTQHAELHIGTNQPGVGDGAFPGAGSTIQTIDMDDIRNLNASLPGQGTALAFHEMMENFNAHGLGFGAGAFGPSHEVGLEAESDLLEDVGIAGRRLNAAARVTVIPAPAGQPTGPNITYQRRVRVFTHYFLEIIERVTTGSPTGPGADFERVSARRIPKVQVSQRTVDSFASGSTVMPPAGNATLAAVLADLNANADSTVLIEGFADSVGGAASNRTLSRNRTTAARAFFIANGITADRIAVVGRGETNFVAGNDTEAGRRQNRRIQLTVHRP